MNTSVKILVIVVLALVTAYAHVAATHSSDHPMQRLEGRWHVVGRIGEQEIRYAATATLKLAGQVLRLDLAEAGSAAQTWMTWILAPDSHNGQIACFAIDAAEQPPVAEYLLHRA